MQQHLLALYREYLALQDTEEWHNGSGAVAWKVDRLRDELIEAGFQWPDEPEVDGEKRLFERNEK